VRGDLQSFGNRPSCIDQHQLSLVVHRPWTDCAPIPSPQSGHDGNGFLTIPDANHLIKILLAGQGVPYSCWFKDILKVERGFSDLCCANCLAVYYNFAHRQLWALLELGTGSKGAPPGGWLKRGDCGRSWGGTRFSPVFPPPGGTKVFVRMWAVMKAGVVAHA